VLTGIALLENDNGQINIRYPQRTNRRLATYKIFRLNQPGLSKRLFSEILKANNTDTEIEPVSTYPAFEVSFREPPARPGEKICPLYIATLKTDCLVIRDIRIIRKLDGTLKVSWPHRKKASGTLFPVAYPFRREARAYFDNEILERVKQHDNTAI
jgi:DNA-binding cell septation regulator SpoVG